MESAEEEFKEQLSEARTKIEQLNLASTEQEELIDDLQKRHSQLQQDHQKKCDEFDQLNKLHEEN